MKLSTVMIYIFPSALIEPPYDLPVKCMLLFCTTLDNVNVNSAPSTCSKVNVVPSINGPDISFSCLMLLSHISHRYSIL